MQTGSLDVINSQFTPGKPPLYDVLILIPLILKFNKYLLLFLFVEELRLYVY